MGKIRVLPEVVASQVAAGEVVERPASVLKELLENSLDAGARSLEVEVRGAGTALLRVTDDGSGMDREDALMALERHATSKIATAGDLASVRTMGFRGEALPSVASVSEFRLLTRCPAHEAGTELEVRGGKIGAVREAGVAPGTTVEVRSLFFNVPARRKFLRSAATESAHLDRAVETVALAFPAAAIHYLREGRTIYRLPSAPHPGVRIADLYGAEALHELLEVPEFSSGGIVVSGFVSRPGITRGDRSRQFFFVNGRAVENGFLSAGVREPYRQLLEPGRQPSIFLRVDMDPRAVDCNVHPAKREVRFRNGGAVRDVVRGAVEGALREVRAEWLRPVRTHVMAAAAASPSSAPAGAHQPELPRRAPEARPAEMVAAPPAHSEGAGGEYRIIGLLSRRYLLMEGPEGMVVLDRRAARQRILFERLQRGVEGRAVSSQALLIPEVVELGPRELEAVAARLPVLASSGFGVEIFGARSLKVEALPDFLAGRDPRRVIEEFASECAEGASGRLRGAAAADAARRTVARMGADDDPVPDESAQRALVGQLLACELPYCDPEGRPVMLQFSWRDLDRKFGRT